MAVDTLTQIVTVALGALAIIWHQQRTTDKLHDGFLGIGMPAAAASEAPGADLPHKRLEDSDTN